MTGGKARTRVTRSAHPEDEIQHEDHVLHARADVREVVAASAIVHHRAGATGTRLSQNQRPRDRALVDSGGLARSLARFARCFNSRR